MFLKKIFFFTQIFVNYLNLFETIKKRIKSFSIQESKNFYSIDKNNDKMDPTIFQIHSKIQKEIFLKKLYPKHNLSNNIVKSWSNVDDKFDRAERVRKIINKHIFAKRNFKNIQYEKIFKKLKKNGICEISNLDISYDKTLKIVKSLKKRSAYPSHVPWLANETKVKFNKLRKSVFATYDLEEIFKYHDLIKLVFNSQIINIIYKYFGCMPTLCSLNLYWNFANKKNEGPKFFHRDVDDYKILNLFCILTNTNFNNGSYSHITQTHNPKATNKILSSSKNNKYNIDANDIFNLPFNGYGFEQIYNSLFKKKIKSFFGKAGKVIIADGYGLHKADNSNEDRLMFWATYSLTKTSCRVSNKPLQKKIKFNIIKNVIEPNIENKYIGRHLIEF